MVKLCPKCGCLTSYNSWFGAFCCNACGNVFGDTAKVKHARWDLADDGDGVVCSNCREDFCNIYLEVDRFKYCPNCGAKMNLE